MIQFNLLPKVKAEYIKAERLQRTVMIIACLVTAAALLLLILLLAVSGFQKHELSNLADQVKQDSAELQKTPNLNQVLTVQNQLGALPGLHDKKPVVTRLLGQPGQAGFLDQITPTQVSISDIKIDFNAHTLALSGDASSVDEINTFVDTLKFTYFVNGSNKDKWTAGTSYSKGDGVSSTSSNTIYEATSNNTATGDNEPGVGSSWKSDWKLAPNAFSAVVLASYGTGSGSASYSITLNFDSTLFSEDAPITLIVPNKVTTRSVTDQPTNTQASTSTSTSNPLFKASTPAKTQ